MRRAMAVLVALSLTGCSTWRPISKEQLAPTITERKPSRIRLIRTDSVLEVRRPEVRGDSLFGYTETPTGRSAVAVPLGNIESGAIRGNNPKVASLVGATVFFMFLGVVMTSSPPAIR